MKVVEAKEILATMELSNSALDKATALIEGLADVDELPDDLLDKMLAIIDKEAIDKGDEVSDEEVLAYLEKTKTVVKK